MADVSLGCEPKGADRCQLAVLGPLLTKQSQRIYELLVKILEWKPKVVEEEVEEQKIVVEE